MDVARALTPDERAVPEVLHDLAPREDSVGRAGEEREQRELGRGQLDLATVDAHAVAHEVELEAAYAYDGALSRGAVELVPREAQRAIIGSDAYFGGLGLATAATLQPALLHRGLARAAVDAGANVLQERRVTDISKDVSGFTITTPAGAIKADSPAGRYLAERGVERKDFNSYGSRRGNHEVMIRGTFANIRLRNLLLNDVSGGFTRDFTASPDAGPVPIYDAAQRYAEAGIPLLVLGGKEYGSGSSRDWAAKGTRLLGVRAVLAESFERIHRSNLIGMGVLPLQFPPGEAASSLGLDGTEVFDVSGVTALNDGSIPATVHVTATRDGADSVHFDAALRIDTPGEAEYYRHGGILQCVLRAMARKTS